LSIKYITRKSCTTCGGAITLRSSGVHTPEPEEAAPVFYQFDYPISFLKPQSFIFPHILGKGNEGVAALCGVGGVKAFRRSHSPCKAVPAFEEWSFGSFSSIRK
jgi:hypothetical protein